MLEYYIANKQSKYIHQSDFWPRSKMMNNYTLTKRIFLLILLFTSRTVVSIAQTNVSGFISTNTTWNLAGSPYIVIGNVLVSYGYTLTVEPGVVVKFNNDKAI